MNKKISFIHLICLQNLFNCIPIFMIDIFYDNLTYLGNQLNHKLFLFAWVLSTVYGFYFYTKKIWDIYTIPYNKKNHRLICLGMVIGTMIPYSTYTILKDLHVWIPILCTSAFVYEWLKYIPITLNKQSKIFYLNILISILFTFGLGHITGFCEIYFSWSCNLILALWIHHASHQS